MNRLLILSRDAGEYLTLLRSAGLEQLEMDAVERPEEMGPGCTRANLVLGEPDLVKTILPDLADLDWVQSTWAGIRPLADSGGRKDYLLTNVKDVFGPLMSEYVVCHMLVHERRIFQQHAARQKKIWDATVPGQLRGKTMGILGMGSIGQAIARTARFFGMKTKGYSRSPSSCEFIDQTYDRHDSLPAFVRDLDYLVSVLPDTPETASLINQAVFQAMKPQALLINVGRGSVLDENALVRALKRGDIAGAVLDVFRKEPLPESHPFWEAPGIMITAHTAAISFAGDIAPVFIENYQRFLLGKPLKYLVDLDQGY